MVRTLSEQMVHPQRTASENMKNYEDFFTPLAILRVMRYNIIIVFSRKETLSCQKNRIF